MDAEVLGRRARIQPSARVVIVMRVGALHQSVYHKVGELAQYLIEQSAVCITGNDRCTV
jgi:hypothetical protein